MRCIHKPEPSVSNKSKASRISWRCSSVNSGRPRGRVGRGPTAAGFRAAVEDEAAAAAAYEKTKQDKGNGIQWTPGKPESTFEYVLG